MLAMTAGFATLVTILATSPVAGSAVPVEVGPDVHEKVFEVLRAQPDVVVTRHERSRARGSAEEVTVAVDTLAIGVDALRSLERMADDLGPPPRHMPRLLQGQRYASLFRVGDRRASGPGDLWIDFRGPLVIYRSGRDSTVRTFRRREAEMADLLFRLDRSDRALRNLAVAFRVPLEGPQAPGPPDSMAVSTSPPPAPPDVPPVIAHSRVPVLKSSTKPVYPAAAKRDRVEGTVTVKVLVDVDGRPSEVRIVKSIPALDNAAIATVVRWRFEPAYDGDRPRAEWLVVPVVFDLP